MRKWIAITAMISLFLTGCGNQNPSTDKKEPEEEKQQVVIPKYEISSDYYKVLSPFEASESRGLTVAKINNRLDMDELEIGLMRLSQEAYSPKDFYYQEGQYLKKDDLRKWLSRKGSKTGGNLGLNPPLKEKDENKEEANEKSPIYLSHILEQNYVQIDEDGEPILKGLSLGIALNSVHYYTQEQGYPREYKIPFEEMKREGERLAQEIVNQVREIPEFSRIPIFIGLFEQQPKNSLVPGTYFQTTYLNASDESIRKWKSTDEKYYLFPSSNATLDHQSDASRFTSFKADLQEYFPNYTGVIGEGFYQNDQLTRLRINIPVQFFGKAEIVGFTQYVTGKVMEIFPDYVKVSVYINSIEGLEAIIVKNKDAKEPHIQILSPF